MSDLHIKITPEEKHHLDALASAAEKSVSAMVTNAYSTLISTENQNLVLADIPDIIKAPQNSCPQGFSLNLQSRYRSCQKQVLIQKKGLSYQR